MTLPTCNWNPLGKIGYFEKFELYSMVWKDEFGINLQEYTVSSAPFGGPVALLRNKLESDKQELFIFTPCCTLLSTVKKFEGKLVYFGWSLKEDLICVRDDGLCTFFDIYGSKKRSFSVDGLKNGKVFDCRLFHFNGRSGIAMLTSSNKFLLVNNVYNPNMRWLQDIPGFDHQDCIWNVVIMDNETNIIAASKGVIYLLDGVSGMSSVVRWEASSLAETIVELAVSWDYSSLTLFSSTGQLWIGELVKSSYDIQLKQFCEFDTKSKVKPSYLMWCGKNAVAGLWKNVLLIVDKEKHWLSYAIEKLPVVLAQEIDGIRLIYNDSHEFLRQVPSVVVDVFRIGSLSSGALLLEASKEFQKRTYKADDYMRMIFDRNEVVTAIQQCIESAGHDYSIGNQKMLLRAASFGKSFCPDMDSESFVNMCRTLRLLNAVRHHKIAIPLSYKQFNELTVDTLLDKLVTRHEYLTAIKVSNYLNIPEERGVMRILSNWAQHKVRQTETDDELLAQEINTKLGYFKRISYAEIAGYALENGRTQLAIRLSEFEIIPSRQVPLLLKLKEHRQAMQKAILSGDTDLIYSVILHLKNALASSDFLMIIRDYKVAYSLYQKICKAEDKDKLKELYYQKDDFISQGFCYLADSYKTEKVDLRQSYLQSACDAYRKAKSDFLVTQTEEEIKLLRNQQKLEEKFRQKFTDLSVQEIAKKLLEEKEYKLAEEFRKDCKMPDKRYWWLKITVLAEQREFLELEKFCKSKKSPIGYEPFVSMCLKMKNKYEAQKYVPRCKEENKVALYVKCGQFEEAAKVAYEGKDEEALEFILRKCGTANVNLVNKIRQLISTLKNEKTPYTNLRFNVFN